VDELDIIAERIRKDLIAKDEARERLLPLCRDAIRYSSNAIRAVHRQEFTQAGEMLRDARRLLSEGEEVLEGCNELRGTGIIRDSQKEYAEASITLALVTGQELPDPAGLRVDSSAYLNGLGEAVGEVRRYLLDAMRKGDLSRGEELLAVMDDIYSVLVTMDFPDAITGGLRRTTDMVRGVLERTRSDLTLAMRQKELESRLDDFQRDKPKKTKPATEKSQPVEKEAMLQEETQLNSAEQEVYRALDEWRNRKSNEESLPPYIIARNSWLKEIIRLGPTSVKQLNSIKGFGERRVTKYGKDIIAIINRKRGGQ
jgi:translin